jgi:hypothetical protein
MIGTTLPYATHSGQRPEASPSGDRRLPIPRRRKSFLRELRASVVNNAFAVRRVSDPCAGPSRPVPEDVLAP